MKKYYFSDDSNKHGPFSIEELKHQNLKRNTKIWYYGLEDWTELNQIDELKSIHDSIPPSLVSFHNEQSKPKKQKWIFSFPKTIKPKWVLIIVSLIVILIFGIKMSQNKENYELYKSVEESSYSTDESFQMYVDKFYRDLEVHGIFPKRPEKLIIKFSKLDKIDNATHIHGLSYGSGDDDLIEIYINPTTWKNFNKPKRYYLLYHELAHDILNLDDLEATPENEGELLYPAIASYENITMDDFIESSHRLFEEVAKNE